jgi:hypothetical protein
MLPLAISLMMSATFTPSVLTPQIAEVATTTPQDIWVQHLHECENPTNIPRILDTNGQYSYGYVSFQMPTWLYYGKQFGATEENIKDDELQKQIAEYILQTKGWTDWWNCGRVTIKWYGSYPLP